MKVVLKCLCLPGLVMLLAVTAAACGSGQSQPAGTPAGEQQADTGEEIPPATTAAATTTASTAAVIRDGLSAPGYMTFVINVHDTVHVDESADTILRLIGIYEKYGVRGDFYLTAPMVSLYAERRPEVIERLRDSNMTISYHVRPPHPLYNGFDAGLKSLDDAALAAAITDYENYRLDLATGGLLRDQPGGYAYVASVFGRDPVVASAPNSDRRLWSAAEKVYAGLGAHATVLYHEEGTDPKQPFEWVEGLLIRPSDFSVTRWGEPGREGKEPFWWNMLSTSKAAEYNPTAYLQGQLADWQTKNTGRSPFITALIHENNFYRQGAEAWTSIYYADTGKKQPLTPPYDLNASDPSKPRSQAEQDAIWAAYEEMVAWAAANLRVATSEDIVALAGGSR